MARPTAWQPSGLWVLEHLDEGTDETKEVIGTYDEVRSLLANLRASGRAGYLFPAMYLDCVKCDSDELHASASRIARNMLNEDAVLIRTESTRFFLAFCFAPTQATDCEPGMFYIQFDRCSGALWDDADRQAFAALGLQIVS